MTAINPDDAYLELITANPCLAGGECKEDHNNGITNVGVRMKTLTTTADITIITTPKGTAYSVENNDAVQTWYTKCLAGSDCIAWKQHNNPAWLEHSENYY